MNPYNFTIDNHFFEPREYKASTKTEDEIQGLLFDLDLPDIDRYEINLKSNALLQKLSVYNRLPDIFNNELNYNKIFPIIREQLPQEHEEIQIDAGKNLIGLMEKYP